MTSFKIPPELGDPYALTFGSNPSPEPQAGSGRIPNPAPVPTSASSPSVVTSPVPRPPPTPAVIKIQRFVGVGHMNLLHLKDVYRDKVIPLVDKSYGTYTGFYLFKDLEPVPIDNQFLDPLSIPVYDNYRNPTEWVIDENTKWWKNLDAICIQASQYNMTIIPTIFDFNGSPNDPFLTHLPYPYTALNWNDTIQGDYVKKVVQHIQSSGVNYILNLGTKYYSDTPILPDYVWIRDLIMFLLNQCGVPSDKLSLTTGPGVNLYTKNPYCRYAMWTGSNVPADDQINNEEYVDNQWGGTGRAAIYDISGSLVGGYAKYLTDCTTAAIPCMNMWKMQEFLSNVPIGMSITDPNIMNYIFAPHQREAMRIVLGNPKTNNGFIDFS